MPFSVGSVGSTAPSIADAGKVGVQIHDQPNVPGGVGMSSGAPVAALTASTVVSTAISRRTRPCGVIVDHGLLGDDEVDALHAGERQGAPCENLVPAVVCVVLHCDDDVFGAGDQVHGATHALDHLARDHPVGQVAVLIDLQRAEHREIDVPAADHRERVGAVEIGAAGELRDGFLARVDEIGVHVRV